MSLITLMAVGLHANGEKPVVQKSFRRIPPNERIAPSELVQRLCKDKPEFEDSEWPDESSFVDKKEVPDKVYDEAMHWIRTIVKPGWLPSDLRDNWLQAVKKNSLGRPNVGYLVARYTIEGAQIQLQESRGALGILIKPRLPLQKGQTIENFVKASICMYINIPDEKLNLIDFLFGPITVRGMVLYKPFSFKGKTVNTGAVMCDYDRQDPEVWDHRMWYTYSKMWTDGQRVYISFVKRDGTKLEGSYAGALRSVRPRF